MLTSAFPFKCMCRHTGGTLVRWWMLTWKWGIRWYQGTSCCYSLVGQRSWPCTVVMVLCKSELTTITKTFFCNSLQILRRHLKSLPNWSHVHFDIHEVKGSLPILNAPSFSQKLRDLIRLHFSFWHHAGVSHPTMASSASCEDLTPYFQDEMFPAGMKRNSSKLEGMQVHKANGLISERYRSFILVQFTHSWVVWGPYQTALLYHHFLICYLIQGTLSCII